jgi:hypothetical protein
MLLESPVMIGMGGQLGGPILQEVNKTANYSYSFSRGGGDD